MNENHVIQCVLKETKRYLNKYVILTVMLCSFGLASAQNSDGKVTGTVLAESNGEPLIGVNILVKGSPLGTMTDLNGVFTVKAKTGETLRVSYIGYEAQNVKVTGSNLTIRLKENYKSLNEVVVIGYGTQKRKDVTGSISSVTGDDLRKTQPATFDQALQGKVAGVVVQQISGQPGGGVSIQIHGISSISSTNSPLYVIDGVIIPPSSDPGNGSNPLNTINPSEIESIDVLKDASATAIYGSQATNGVVVITTKRGTVSAPEITYEGYMGYQQIPSKLPIVNLQQLASIINDRSTNWGFDVRPEFANPKYLGTGTDWQNELFRTAPETNHSLTIRGGDKSTQYMFSVGYYDQQGIALGSDFQRYSVRLNLDNKTTNWLKIGTSLQMANVVENVNATNAGVIQNSLNLTSDIPVKNSDGTWGGVSNNSGWVTAPANPVAMAQINTNMNYRYQILGNVYAEIKFTKDLSLRNEVSGNFDFLTNKGFQPQTTFGKYTTPNPTSSTFSYNQNITTVVRNYFTYGHAFGKSTLNVVAGHEASLSTNANVSASRSTFASNNVQAISSGDPTTATNGGSTGDGASESYLGRVNFSLIDKYLFTVNVRDDGSSNFPSDIRWALTSSGALAWKIKNEKFLEKATAINDLKLRLSYGLTNNQGIPGNTYVSQLSTVANGLSGIGQYQANLANPYVQWEKTKSTNIGLDGTLFNSILDFSIEYYDRFTDGLLLQEPFPEYSGTTTSWSPGAMKSPYVNVGSISNKGFDIRIGTTNINTKNFRWRTDVTISHNDNKVLSLGSGGKDASLVSGNSRTVVGQPIGEFYGYVYDGIFSTANDFKTHALPADQSGNPRPISKSYGGIWYGDHMYKDLNGDGIIDTRDQTNLGSPYPAFQFGFNNTFTYKDFDLNIFFAGSVGNKVFNQLAMNLDNPIQNTNYFTGALNYARPALINPNGDATNVNNVYVTNPNTTIVSLRNDNTNENDRMSNLYLEDGSFIRCKTIALGYTFPAKLLAKIKIHSLRVYVNVANAFIITKYTGMDPEIGSWNPLQSGYDNGYYPQSRVYTVGLNVKL
jgi:TonB-linked SusC/RagA family outer membrane protein